MAPSLPASPLTASLPSSLPAFPPYCQPSPLTVPSSHIIPYLVVLFQHLTGRLSIESQHSNSLFTALLFFPHSLSTFTLLFTTPHCPLSTPTSLLIYFVLFMALSSLVTSPCPPSLQVFSSLLSKLYLLLSTSHIAAFLHVTHPHRQLKTNILFLIHSTSPQDNIVQFTSLQTLGSQTLLSL